MDPSRRQFIKSALLLGGGTFLTPMSLPARQSQKPEWLPAYIMLEKEGTLSDRVEAAYELFKECMLCPRECGVNRMKGDAGYCRATSKLVVYSAHPHFGEEQSLVGKQGSGTIFLSNCNLRCVFCQNWSIAHLGHGKDISDRDLANMMLYLQSIGCHNINLVTPTHVMPNILNALRIAIKKGLRLPLVYNTSGYEKVSILKLLDGIVDIYLPDMKYMDPDKANTYSPGAPDYPQASQDSVMEMHRQVGLHQVGADGIAKKGVMIRHLVMPNRVADTKKFVQWVAENLPKSTYVNIMSHYHVEYKAFDYPEIWRRINVEEYVEAMTWAKQYGLTNLDPDSIRTFRIYLKEKD